MEQRVAVWDVNPIVESHRPVNLRVFWGSCVSSVQMPCRLSPRAFLSGLVWGVRLHPLLQVENLYTNVQLPLERDVTRSQSLMNMLVLGLNIRI